MNAVARAQVLVGGQRQLGFFPEFAGEKLTIKGALDPLLERVASLAEDNNVCLLASGDPLFFGIGSTVVKRLGAEHVEIIPQPSSMQLAFARAGLAWDDAVLTSVHGRAIYGLVSRLRRAKKAAVFTDNENSPARIASHFLEYGDAAWSAWVCEHLSGPEERVRTFDLVSLAECRDISPLNVLLLQRPADWRPPPVVPFLPEEMFAKKMPKAGLITKREIRMLSIAALQLRPESVVWDIGAGSGSIAIEAALLASHGSVYAVEVDAECAGYCRDNVRALSTDNVRVVEGRAPEALVDLDDPDAVFVGGSKGSMEEIISVALERLKPGGRLVVNAITFENVAETYAAFRARRIDPEVTLLQVSRGVPLARYLRYEALNPIHSFAVTKPIAVDSVET
jgi:precorrin-6Y C5,15-methyltransferase (decarboxylating)